MDATTTSVEAVLSQLSVVSPHAGSGKSECGYCHATKPTRWSYGMGCSRLTCVDYLELCNKGWRRSGCYLYKPENSKSCCPNITIRLDSRRFHASAAQNRVLRRLNEFIEGGGHTVETAAAQSGAPPSTGPTARPDADGVFDLAVVHAVKRLLDAAVWKTFPVLKHLHAAASASLHPLSKALAHTAPPIDGVAPTHTCGVSLAVAAATLDRDRMREDDSGGGVGGGTPVPPAETAVSTTNAVPGAATKKVKLRPSLDAVKAVAATIVEAAQRELTEVLKAAETPVAGSSSVGDVGSTAAAAAAASAALSRVRFSVSPSTGHINIALPARATESHSVGADETMLKSSSGGADDSNVSAASAAASPEHHSDSSDYKQPSGKAHVHPRSTPATTKVAALPSYSSTTAATASSSAASAASALPTSTYSASALPTSTYAASSPAAHTWRVVSVPSAFDEESWRLYKKYQVAVHGDEDSECTREQYTRFLCDSPLIREPFGALRGQDLKHAAVPSSSVAAAANAFSATASSATAAAARGGRGGGRTAALASPATLIPWDSDVGVAVSKAADAESAAWKAAVSSNSGGDATTNTTSGSATTAAAAEAAAASAAVTVGTQSSGSSSSSSPTTLAVPSTTASSATIATTSVSSAMPTAHSRPASRRGSNSASTAIAADASKHAYTGFRVGQAFISPDLPGGSRCVSSGSSATGASISAAAVSAAGSAAASSTSDTPSHDIVRLGYGSFHQKYYLDKKLIAVGVVDVLPTCLSSVYVFYDPDVSDSLQLGKLTALREIQWVQSAAHYAPALVYYYMGFYVHSCPKMRYKAEYEPSELRCELARQWVPISIARPRLDIAKFCALDHDLTPAESESAAAVNVAESAACAGLMNRIPIVFGGEGVDTPTLENTAVLRQLNERGRKYCIELLKPLADRVGSTLLSRIVVRVN